MAADYTLALKMLKTRLNRPAGDTLLDNHLLERLMAADEAMARTGIHLSAASSDDLMLLVDTVAWRYLNRDKPGGMPEWLRLARRERWLAERRGGNDP